MSRILAVIVLYHMAPSESVSYAALSRRLLADPDFAARVSLLVLDNSPLAQEMPAGATATYRHDGSNPGLAKRYNYALAQAVRTGATWLLLLDQDTGVTPEYLDELEALSESLAGDGRIVGIVPKLVAGSHVYSPHGPQYTQPARIPAMDSYGVFGGTIRPFNSAALVRVAALEAVGGFPEEYWLDYLDHATFALLQARGDFFLMHACLAHDLSFHRADKHADPANAARHRNQLSAMVRFYYDHGLPAERRRMRVDLLKSTLKSLKHGHPSEATRYLRAALQGRPQ